MSNVELRGRNEAAGDASPNGVGRKRSDTATVSIDKAIGVRDTSAFERVEKPEVSMKEEIVEGFVHRFIDNVPVDIIKEMSASKLLVFGLLAYGIVIGIFLYFSIGGFIQGRKEEFVSLDSSSGQCSEVTRTLTGVYYASSDGLWEGKVGYQYTKTIYAFEFQGMKTTDAEFEDTLNTLKTNELAPIGIKQAGYSLSYNLLLWMHYSTQFTIGTAVQLFSFSGEPGDVFNRIYNAGGIANDADRCNAGSSKRYDINIAKMDMTWSAAEYSADSSCTSISSMQDLGYNEDYDKDDFTISFDLVTLTSALAVNLGLLKTIYLESVGENFILNITYGGETVLSPLQLYFDPRYANCIIIRMKADQITCKFKCMV
jgi:hypothetical protein